MMDVLVLRVDKLVFKLENGFSNIYLPTNRTAHLEQINECKVFPLNSHGKEKLLSIYIISHNIC